MYIQPDPTFEQVHSRGKPTIRTRTINRKPIRKGFTTARATTKTIKKRFFSRSRRANVVCGRGRSEKVDFFLWRSRSSERPSPLVFRPVFVARVPAACSPRSAAPLPHRRDGPWLKGFGQISSIERGSERARRDRRAFVVGTLANPPIRFDCVFQRVI